MGRWVLSMVVVLPLLGCSESSQEPGRSSRQLVTRAGKPAELMVPRMSASHAAIGRVSTPLPPPAARRVDRPAVRLHRVAGAAAGSLAGARQEVERSRTVDGEPIEFARWLTATTTPEGWALAWEGTRPDPLAADHVVAAYGYEVRRQIGEALYDCRGTARTQAELDEAIAVCARLRAD
jgi:hypothetical protein